MGSNSEAKIYKLINKKTEGDYWVINKGVIKIMRGYYMTFFVLQILCTIGIAI